MSEGNHQIQLINNNDNNGNYGIIQTNRLKKWILFLVLVLSGAMMIDFIVIEGVIFCNYQYSFSISLSIYGCIFFGILFMIMNKRINPFRTQGDGHLNIFEFKIAGISGLAWAVNYVFLLMANPYTPGFYQTIFNELNIVLVAVGSYIFLARKYYSFQIVSIFFILIGGLIPLGEGVVGGTRNDIIWYPLYMLGAGAIGVANIIAENAFQNLRDKQTGKHLISTLQFYFATNCWALIFTLAFWFIPSAAYKTNFNEHTTKGLSCILSFGVSQYCDEYNEYVVSCCDSIDDTGSCDTNIPWLGILGIWLSSTLSFIAVIAGAGLAKIDGSMYMTIGYTVGPIIAGITFTIKPILGVFYSSLSKWDIASFIVTFIGVCMFKFTMVDDRFQPPNFKKHNDKYQSRFDLRYMTIEKPDLILNDNDIDKW